MRVLNGLLLLAAIIGLAAVSWWGMTQSTYGPAVAEAKLQANAELALKNVGHEWATVEMDGQHARLSGTAPTPEAAMDAMNTVLTSSGNGGVVFGGVTAVSQKTDPAPEISPYVWGASKTDDGQIILTGYVPSNAIRGAIVADAEVIAPGKVDDRMKIGAGVPGGNWQGIARQGLSQLALLDNGNLLLSDERLSLNGMTMDDGVRARVSADVLNVAAPYTAEAAIRGAGRWQAVHKAGRLVLTGTVDSEAERGEIVEIARKFYSGDVADEMSVGTDAYEGWIEGVRLGLPHFAKFQNGNMAFDPEGDGFAFNGEASGSTLEYLRQDMAKLTGPYAANIKAEAVSVDVDEIAGIDFDADPLLACQAAFNTVLEFNSVVFTTASAEISRESGDTLDKLMAVGAKCDPSLSFELAGHTDNQGDRESNVALSEARAQAVANYMINAGFNGDRLRPVGYGPDQPAADNATPEGRALNRRIEFNILERSE